MNDALGAAVLSASLVVSIACSDAGTYTETNRVIVFNWERWSRAGPWGATGTLDGDSLTVRYNPIMQLTDFEDAVYVRMP